jgi:hypothetical protein
MMVSVTRQNVMSCDSLIIARFHLTHAERVVGEVHQVVQRLRMKTRADLPLSTASAARLKNNNGEPSSPPS